MGKGVSTAWRDIRHDPDFPKPIRLSAGCTRFKVGDIRAYLAMKADASAKPKLSQRVKGQVTE
jgi:predicted DNA-binding transcriptional regulator AlpA